MDREAARVYLRYCALYAPGEYRKENSVLGASGNDDHGGLDWASMFRQEARAMVLRWVIMLIGGIVLALVGPIILRHLR